MKNARFASLALTLLSLFFVAPVHADDAQKTYRFALKGRTWTVQADRLQRKGALILFRGNVKATSNRGDKIHSDTAELCLKLGQEKLILTPVKVGGIIKGD